MQEGKGLEVRSRHHDGAFDGSRDKKTRYTKMTYFNVRGKKLTI